MEWRAFLAITLSIFVLLAFQVFFPEQQNATAPQGNKANTELAQKAPSKVEHHTNGAMKQESIGTRTRKPLRQPKDVVIETDLYKAVFTEEGGAVKAFYLKKYRETVEKDSPPVNLVNAVPPVLPLAIGFTGKTSGSFEPIFMDAQKGEDTLTFIGEIEGGTKVKEVFKFKKDSYWIDLEIEVLGQGKDFPVIALSNRPVLKSSRYSFQGISYYGKDGLQEVKLDKGETKTYHGPIKWLGIGDKYFMASVIPLTPEVPEWQVSMSLIEGDGLSTAWLSPRFAGKAPQKLSLGLYFGPKEIDVLKAVDHSLAEAINFGWFDVLAKPLLYFLKFLYKFTHNYGVAIIIVTVLIKIAFWPLAHKSAKAMKTMQKLQPRLQKLKEKYGDDKERLNKELLQLYKTYKINPMSGCLPMLLQLPVFFALYKVLLQAIELRHAPFMLWINDLSAPDRLMIPGVDIPMVHGIPVLTILMGVSMWGQQKMSPASLDPTQAKMMQFLPVIFTFMFLTFPSGLVLYWLVNNILSVAQQYYINKFTD
ncbi:membrane protein insertase YidC [Dissulfuribacter thermophilus]|nr:membrane protein insertase YidC [Dissulfuribacter thermophilus]